MNYHKSFATHLFYCTNIYCTVYTHTYGTYTRGVYSLGIYIFCGLDVDSEFMFFFGNILMHFYYNIDSNKFLLSPDQGEIEKLRKNIKLSCWQILLNKNVKVYGGRKVTYCLSAERGPIFI